jgi:hypothetical protein
MGLIENGVPSNLMDYSHFPSKKDIFWYTPLSETPSVHHAPSVFTGAVFATFTAFTGVGLGAAFFGGEALELGGGVLRRRGSWKCSTHFITHRFIVL